MNGSILYRDDVDYTQFDVGGFFHDLCIDAILADIVASDKAGMDGPFRQKPKKLEDVLFRQAVMKDLERPAIREIIDKFMNQYAQYHTYQEYGRSLPQLQTRQKWLLDAAQAYCLCLSSLREGLKTAAPDSEGLRLFLNCLAEYMETDVYAALRNDTRQCVERLNAVQYRMDLRLNKNKVEIRMDHESSEDYIEKLVRVFHRYGISPSPRMVPFPGVNLETLELSVLDHLVELYPEEFLQLEEFCRRHPSFGAELVDTFTSELRFYLSYMKYMNRMKEKGYPFAYADFHGRKTIKILDGYDLSLAQALESSVTPNDFIMGEGESFIVTGPNQGGKTTFVRMVGQVAYFASLGLPAPCSAVETYFMDGIFTHFAREEDLSSNYGRLKEELQRSKSILDVMPHNSMIIFNDMFSSTTTYDALEIGKRLLHLLARRGCLCLFATNIHELAETAQGLVCLHAARETDAKEYRVTRSSSEEAFVNPLMIQNHLKYEDIRSRFQ